MKRLTITGYVGNPPEVRVGPEGESFVTFQVGVPVGTKSKPKTDWIDVSCNGKVAEFVQNNVKVGNKVLVDGFPSPDAYMKDGQPVAVQKLYANIVESLSKKENEQSSEPQDNSHTDRN